MASSMTDKKTCSKCGLTKWVSPCDGCQALFCLKHASEHQEELTIQLAKIEEESTLLQQLHIQDEECQEHPLFSQIDVWEQDTVAKIIQTAETARNTLRELFEQSNTRKKLVFKEFHEQLQSRRETEHYTEIELNQWKEQLMNIKKQLETPCDVELIFDKELPPIDLIKINMTKPNSFVAQAVLTSEDKHVSDCSCDSELEKSKTTTECVLVCEQNEPSAIPKVESPEIEPVPCSTSNILLDPTQNNHLFLLQISPTNQSQLLPILNQLTDHHSDIFDEEEACLNGLRCGEQGTIFIDLFDRPLNEQNCFLDTISELENVYFIYIRGNPAEDDQERADFFRRYAKIKGIFENEQRLMVQWAIDTAAEFKKTGDMYVKTGDKDKGRQCFEQGITLYKRLSVFLNEKRRVR